MASGGNNNNNNNNPWYKRKFDKFRYLTRGQPWELTHDTVAQELPGLLPPGDGDEGSKLTADMAKLVVDQKNKKREFHIEYDDAPKKKTSGGYVMSIQVLNVDHRGFRFTAEGETQVECNESFWPIVPLLMAHYFSPKIVGRPGDVSNNKY